MLFMVLALAACGPAQPEVDDETLMAQTRQIALDYRVDGDLGRAQAALDALGVANVHQWLILVAEADIAQGASVETDALAKLIGDLKLASPTVQRYAEERGLVARVARSGTNMAAGEPVVQRSGAAASSQGDTSSQPPTPTPALPTPTPVPDTPTSAPTPTPLPAPEVRATSLMNVRAGPGTDYPIAGSLPADGAARITGKNPAGDWWEIQLDDGTSGWIYGPLVETSGDTAAVAVAARIPTPPPATPTPIPQPTSPPAPTATPAPAGPDFRLVEQRLWDVEENGGFLSGDSVNCGEKQVLRVMVKDAAGNPLNGATVQGVYRNELRTTGEKGPGLAEFDINVDGDDVVVLRDSDGRQVTSDRAKGNTAKTYNIPFAQLIQGRYCRDDASCQAFVDTHGCFGHFSWTVVFQRSY